MGRFYIIIFVIFILLQNFSIYSTEMSDNQKCPVIYNFHEVNNHPGFYGITPKRFEAIIKYLNTRGYQIRSFMDYYALVLTDRPEKKNTVVFTIDDGDLSALDNAVPILNRYHFGATLFIYTDRYGPYSDFYHRLGDLSNRFEIASHSLSHANLIKIKEKDMNQFYKELVMSKKKLEYYTGKRVKTFAWPYGNYNESMIQSVFLAGYEFQVAAGILHRKKLNDRLCGRFTVTKYTSFKKIEEVLNYKTWE